jgi:hypothetical protein
LDWNTFLGGIDGDDGFDIAVDGSENIYLTGRSFSSWGTPLNPFTGSSDVFVAKLNSSGALIWNTFLGGTGTDMGLGIEVGANGNIYITGQSSASWGTPVNAYSTGRNVFVAMLDSSGALVWNTFFPAGVGIGDLYGIEVDQSGNVYVSSDSPASWGSPLRAFAGGLTDAFVAKLNSSGALIWNTFLGGSGNDQSFNLAIDGNGAIYVSGVSSASWGIPVNTYMGGIDAFVARLDSNGTLVWNTFLGGNGTDYGFGITVDESENIYTTGYSSSTWGVPLNPLSVSAHGFVARLNGAGTLAWNTFIVGGGGHGISNDASGNVYIVTPSADILAVRFDSSGSLVWSTSLGGSGEDFAISIVVGGSGKVYLTGYSQATWGTPINPFGGYRDAFLARLANTVPPTVMIAGNAGVAGATLHYTDGTAKTAIADGTGSYSLRVSTNWSGTVTPSKPGYQFVPDHREYANVTTDRTGENYTATNYWGATPWYGSVSVSSDRSVVTVGRPHVGAEVASYNGVSAGSLTAYVPMLFKNAWGSYDSALYIQNVDPTHSAGITIKFYDNNGDLSCELPDTVAPLASKGFWIPAQSCLPAGWVGGAVVSSDWPIVAVGRPHVGAEVMTYNGFGSGALAAYLPMLFKNAWGSYDSAFYVQNVHGSEPASVTMKFYDSSGLLSCTLDDIVPPMASKGYWVPAQSCLPDGWVGGVKITSNYPIVSVARLHIGSQITTYPGFAGGGGSMYVPMLFKNAWGSYDSAFYVQNLNATYSANITLKFYDSAGSLTCELADSVPALASKGYWVPAQSCLPEGWVGGAVVTANRNIVAVGRPHVGAQVTTYPGIGAGSTSLYLPMLFKNMWGSYNSAFYLQNTDLVNAANVTLKFYDTDGSLSCTRSDSIPAKATLGYWVPSVSCDP